MLLRRSAALPRRGFASFARLLLGAACALPLVAGARSSAQAQVEIPDRATPPAAGSGAKAPPTARRKPAKPAPAAAPAASEDEDDGPGQTPAAKADAKVLVQSGVKLLKQKDYLGALAVFRDAYQRFPSVKLLLNIGTTLKLLGRNAEAANAYQRYLDDPEADPARVSEVGDVLSTLDRVLGRVQLGAAAANSATPAAPNSAMPAPAGASAQPAADASLAAATEVSINSGDWLPLPQARLLRVDPGAYEIAARRDGFAPVTLRGSVGAGELVEVRLQLVALPTAAAAGPLSGGPDDAAAAELALRRSRAAERRSRLGLMLRGHFHISPSGAAALVGPTVDVTDRLEVNVSALLGRFRGGYLGASYAVLPGRFRPIAATGLLVVADDGARYAVRGAVGLEVVINRNLSVFAELGGEHLFNPPMTVFSNAFVPSAGVFGRL